MHDDDLEPAAVIDPRLDNRFDAALADIEARESERAASRAMWHAHHWAEDYDRCLIVGGHPLCRRCFTLYPIALAVAIAGLAGAVLWPAHLDLWFIWLLSVPATVEFMLEQLGVVRYSARRQVAVTTLLAPALGSGFAHELDNSWAWEFWGPVLVFSTLWFLAALGGRRRRNR